MHLSKSCISPHSVLVLPVTLSHFDAKCICVIDQMYLSKFQTVFLLIQWWCCRGPFPTWVLPAAPGTLPWRHTHPMSHQYTHYTMSHEYTHYTHYTQCQAPKPKPASIQVQCHTPSTFGNSVSLLSGQSLPLGIIHVSTGVLPAPLGHDYLEDLAVPGHL